MAALNRHESVCKLLLQRGAIVDSRDNNGDTPLSLLTSSWGLKEAEASTAKLLLSWNAEPDSRNNSGRSPLSFAAQNGFTEICVLLIETGKVDVDSRDVEGRSPMAYAAVHGEFKICKILLNTRKVDVNSKDYRGRTPLWYAGHVREIRWERCRRQRDTFKLLLENGAAQDWGDNNINDERLDHFTWPSGVGESVGFRV